VRVRHVPTKDEEHILTLIMKGKKTLADVEENELGCPRSVFENSSVMWSRPKHSVSSGFVLSHVGLHYRGQAAKNLMAKRPRTDAYLLPEPGNKYDRHAIAILMPSEDSLVHVGYVARDEARTVHSSLWPDGPDCLMVGRYTELGVKI